MVIVLELLLPEFDSGVVVVMVAEFFTLGTQLNGAVAVMVTGTEALTPREPSVIVKIFPASSNPLGEESTFVKQPGRASITLTLLAAAVPLFCAESVYVSVAPLATLAGPLLPTWTSAAVTLTIFSQLLFASFASITTPFGFTVQFPPARGLEYNPATMGAAEKLTSNRPLVGPNTTGAPLATQLKLFETMPQLILPLLVTLLMFAISGVPYVMFVVGKVSDRMV